VIGLRWRLVDCGKLGSTSNSAPVSKPRQQQQTAEDGTGSGGADWSKYQNYGGYSSYGRGGWGGLLNRVWGA
jgi:hypothetical protein